MKAISQINLIRQVFAILCFSIFFIQSESQIPLPLKLFLQKPILQGASISFMAKEVKTSNVLYSYEAEKELTPASIMKTVTTATALEMLGQDFCFETSILYDGEINNGILDGNLYINGSGDPTINSSELTTSKDSVIALWASAIKNAGIREVNGCVIADESIFDTEGVSMKWMREDLGSDYGQGSYGVNIFDNRYTLYLNTNATGTQPSISYTEPSMPFLRFQNYLTSSSIPKDSCYIIGFPYSNERYLYGVMRSNRSHSKIIGDIPEPALYTAQYFNRHLISQGVNIENEPTCYRILSQSGLWKTTKRKKLITTYSLPLKDMVRIINFVSHNLYADVLIKTIGLQYQSKQQEIISSFEKGACVTTNYWSRKGLNTSSLWVYDGSGLAITNKVTANFLCDLYIYMATQSEVSTVFIESLPQVGLDGTIRNMLKGSSLQGKARLKSGSMSRIQSYGGYITKNGKQYSIAILINNFSGRNSEMRKAIEELFLAIF